MEDEFWIKPTNDGYQLYVIPGRKAGLLDDDKVFKCLTDVNLAEQRNAKAIPSALKHIFQLILASPKPIISFQSLR